MKRISTLLLTLIFTTYAFSEEKVGLVLSGGAAKGLIHIGVIKALEENNIPIDYITGTSMGAIIGSLYAIGLSTDQMIDIIRSEDFTSWQTGEILPDDLYYFRKLPNKPDNLSMSFRISQKDSLTIKPNILPINLVNPRQMNYAFIPLYANATAACQSDFNKLMIPFRCVAADIYDKEAVILSEGDLGDAVRTSMTFPFMFRPIMINNRLLFDGGIYNNFPVDVMKNDFAPSYIIGSNVGDETTKRPDPENILEQIETMIMSPNVTNAESDMLLNFKFADNVNIWDFKKIDELVKRGYDSTMLRMNEIKKHVNKRITPNEVTKRRKEFRAKAPKLIFKEIEFSGINEEQQRYIKQYFHLTEAGIGLPEFKQAYYKLLSENIISEILPHAIYDPIKQYYILHLDVKTEDQLKLSLGGNISLNTPNQLFIGVNYQNLNKIGQSAWLDFHLGKVYNGINLGVRLDFLENFYLKPQFVIHQFNYYTGDFLFYENNLTNYFNSDEIYVKADLGFSLTMKSKVEVGLGYGRLTDEYIQDRQLALEYQENDRSIYNILNVFAEAEGNLQNKKMYPTSGRAWRARVQMLYGNEEFTSTTFPQDNRIEPAKLWFTAKAMYDDYFNFSKHFTLGVRADFAYSNREFLNNYTSTIIQAPQFTPTPHSKIVFNEGFSANQYVAVGLKPIYTLNDAFQIRLEGYAFSPFRTILRKSDNTAYYSDYFDRIRYQAELSAVYDFKIATASLYVNYYSIPENNWNFGLNVGFLLFKEKFME